MAAKKPKKTAKKVTSKAGAKTAVKKKSVSAKKAGLPSARNSKSNNISRKNSQDLTKSVKSQPVAVNSSPSEPKPKALQVLTRTYLTDAELEHFKQILMEKLHQLTGDVDMIESEALRKSRTDATGDLSSMPIHMADMGSDTFEQDFTLGLMSSERKIVTEIIAALKRIQDGTYGICEGTGRPIPKARLEANPWARYCVEYASRLEKGQLTKQEESQRWANRHKAEEGESEEVEIEEEEEEEEFDEEDEGEFEPVENDPDLEDLYEIEEEEQQPKEEEHN